MAFKRKVKKSTEPKQKKEKKLTKFVLEAAVISALRKTFGKSVLFNITKKAHQVEIPHYNQDGSLSKSRRVMYRCSECKELYKDEKIFTTNKKGKRVSKKAFACDHTSPVVDPIKGIPRRENGKIDWSVYVDRMFAGVEYFDPSVHTYQENLKGMFSILCHLCHDRKSTEENKIRNEVKKLKKSKKEKK
jgi:hypothetical protein